MGTDWRKKEKREFIFSFSGHFLLLLWFLFFFVFWSYTNWFYDGWELYFWTGVSFLGVLMNFIAVSANDWTMPYKLRWESYERARLLTNNFQYADFRWGKDNPVSGQIFLSSRDIRFPYLADVILFSTTTVSVGDLLQRFAFLALLIECGAIVNTSLYIILQRV